MNDFFKRITGQIAALWGKWSLVQRLILIGIVVAALAGLIAMVTISSAPAMAPVIDAPIRDEAAQDRIITRINQEGIKTSISPTGVIMVPDAASAKRMRAILIREDLIPSGTDPWAIFDQERWTTTDFERNVNLRRAITQMVTDHIKALDDVDDAKVTIVSPERALFASQQNPVTASVIITPKPGSDITQNRKKVEGVQKILKFAVEGLTDENIVITDQNGLVLNDFAGMAAFDRINQIAEEAKHIQRQEAYYRAQILKSLQNTYGEDRVRDLNIKIEMDMSSQTVEKKVIDPITVKPRTPGLAYDDSEQVISVTRSESISTTTWEGTGFNPEGPAGVEGQTSPAYRDMENLYGKVNQSTRTHNEELNETVIKQEKSPQIERKTVSVNIDGRWEIKHDEKNNPVLRPDGSREREYIPMTDDEIRSVEALIQGAIAYSAAKGDSVTVENIQFDRTKQFADEDAAYSRHKQFQLMILLFLAGLALILIGFMIYRMVSRELERRRRQREEELARQQQAIRDNALLEAENEGVEVSMSVEERKRMELLDNAVNMAKEHPGDVAQLIRTWLLEE